MTLGEARNLLDILVDKANNPYFTIPEKDEFLQLAVTDFHYHFQYNIGILIDWLKEIKNIV